MKAELEAIMGRAGFSVAWPASNQTLDASFLIVVDFSGTCAPRSAAPFREETSLASTSIVDGAVLPFSRIDCTALTRAVGPAGDALYGQAMARVLAHELYHVLTRTRDHGRAGIAKPCFRTVDLVAPTFDFEQNIRMQLRSLLSPPTGVDRTDEEAGPSRDPRDRD